MKTIFLLIALFFNVSFIFSQGAIPVNQTFTSNQTIYPFQGISTIYGLDLSGAVTLNSDTSFVQVVLQDIDSVEYLIYEGYALIVDDLGTHSYSNIGEETFFLNNVHPYCIKIFISSGSLQINNLTYRTSGDAKQDSLMSSHKNHIVTEKVNLANQRLEELNLLWRASVNPVALMKISEKQKLFNSDNVSLLYGFDFLHS